MAASLKATGAWVIVTADATPTLVGSPAAGDRYYLWAAWKAYGTTCQVTASPAGWTEVTEFADGTEAAAANVGSVKVACYYRDWVTGDGNPTVDWSVSPVPGAYCMQLWQKDSVDTWGTPTFVTGAHASSAGPVTRDASSTVDVTDDSVVFCLAAIRDDSATFTRGNTAISDSGAAITWADNYVESPATHASSTTSNDIAADLGYRFVDTGAAGVTLQATFTLSAADPGSLLWVVQPVTIPPWTGPVFAAAGTPAPFDNVSSYSSWNIPVPTSGGTGAGIVDLLFVYTEGVTTVTPPAGFAAVPDSPVVCTGTRAHHLDIFWKQASTSSGNYTVTFSEAGYPAAVALRFSGCDSTTPFDVTNSAIQTGTGTGVTPVVSDVTTVANTLLIWASSQRNTGATSCTPPTGFAERADVGDFGAALTGADKHFPSAASTGNITGTWAQLNAMTAWVGALKPAASGITGTVAAALKDATASLAGLMHPKGTVAAAEKKATASLSGKLLESGTVAAALKKATTSVSGRMHPKGTVGAAARKATASLSGAQKQTGTIGAAVRKATTSLSGVEHPRGAVVAAVKKATASLAGVQTQTGTITAAARKATTSMTAAMLPKGTVTAVVSKAVAALAGEHTAGAPITGTIAAAAAHGFGALSGKTGPAGIVAAVKGRATASFAGVMAPQGVVGAAAKKAVAALAGGQLQTGTIAAAKGRVAGSLSGVMAPKGVVGAAAKKAVAALAGGQLQTGTIAAAKSKTLASLSGFMHPRGAVAAALKPVVGSVAGAELGISPIGTIAAAVRRVAAGLSGVEYPRGALAGTARKAAASLAGKLAESGTFTGLLQHPVAGVAGAMQPTGNVTVTIRRLVVAAAATQTQTGIVASALQHSTATLSGVEQPRGALAAILAKTQAAVAGAQLQAGVVGAAVKHTVGSLAGAMAPKGSIAATGKRLVFYASMMPIGQLAAAIKHPVGVLAGYMRPQGTIAAVKAHPFIALAGYMRPKGTIAAQIHKLLGDLRAGPPNGIIAATTHKTSSAAAGVMQPSGTVNITLKKTIGAVTGGQAQLGNTASVLRPAVVTVTGRVSPTGAIDARTGTVVASLAGHYIHHGTATGDLRRLLFTGVGLGGVIDGPLAATLRAVIFAGAHLLTPSAKRTTIIIGEDRVTVVAGEDRVTVVVGEDRGIVIENDARVTTVAGENRFMVIPSAETLTAISE